MPTDSLYRQPCSRSPPVLSLYSPKHPTGLSATEESVVLQRTQKCGFTWHNLQNFTEKCSEDSSQNPLLRTTVLWAFPSFPISSLPHVPVPGLSFLYTRTLADTKQSKDSMCSVRTYQCNAHMIFRYELLFHLFGDLFPFCAGIQTIFLVWSQPIYISQCLSFFCFSNNQKHPPKVKLDPLTWCPSEPTMCFSSTAKLHDRIVNTLWCGHREGRGGWDKSGDEVWHKHCVQSRQLVGSFCVTQKLSSVLCDDLEDWDGEVRGKLKKGMIYRYI